MAEPLPATNRCGFCGEWWAQAHSCRPTTDFLMRQSATKPPPERPEPDCRTCANYNKNYYEHSVCTLAYDPCESGNRYKALPPVRLWRTT